MQISFPVVTRVISRLRTSNFDRTSSYASAALAVIILYVCLSICHTRALLPTNQCWCQETRAIAISCGIKISAVHHLVLSQYTHLTDRQTDRIARAILCIALHAAAW